MSNQTNFDPALQISKQHSKHPNWLDLNVIYDQRDAARAARIRQREKELAEERERKRQIEERRAEFNKSIREVGGKLTLFDLKRLNSVYKQDYVKMVTEEDDKIKEHLSNVENKNLDNQTEL